MTLTIIPTVLAFTKKEFDKRFKKVVSLSDDIQVDIMDGRFVPTKSLPLEKIPSVKKWKKRFEAHLMVNEPMQWLLPLKDKGFSRFIIHYEALDDDDIPLVAAFAKKYELELCLAINPDTPVKKMKSVSKYIKDFLVMGVHPGYNGAPYVKNTPERVKELTLYGHVQVDGGMTDKTIKACADAGATRINTGSFVGNAKDPAAALQLMYDTAR